MSTLPQYLYCFDQRLIVGNNSPAIAKPAEIPGWIKTISGCHAESARALVIQSGAVSLGRILNSVSPCFSATWQIAGMSAICP
jgi:hypothetical protein